MKCDVTNVGDAPGTSRIVAKPMENGLLVATRTKTTRFLNGGEHELLALEFPEAKLASKNYRLGCSLSE